MLAQFEKGCDIYSTSFQQFIKTCPKMQFIWKDCSLYWSF